MKVTARRAATLLGATKNTFCRGFSRVHADQDVRTDCEAPIDVFFRNAVIGRFFADLVAENVIIIELKAVRMLTPEHHTQLLHYLRGTAIEVGFLLNFGPRPQFKRLVYANARKHGPAPP